MNQEDPLVRTTLRIPGNWSHPGELVERLPAGFRLTPEALLLPDHTKIKFTPMPPDDQFADIFRSSCRQPAADDELEIVDSYTVNVVLTGPGGSLTAALTTLRAGAAIVRAGGAGVFIDNSGVAHGGRKWIEMAEDGGPDAVSFAFVGIVRGRQEVWTVGMHVMGLPDIVMKARTPAPMATRSSALSVTSAAVANRSATVTCWPTKAARGFAPWRQAATAAWTPKVRCIIRLDV